MYLKNQLKKVKAHYKALNEFHNAIRDLNFDFSVESYRQLETAQKALLEAYLKRFSSLQDYLGAKVFKSLLDIAGISYSKMSEVLTLIEKEEIIDLDKWIELRNIRNELEHDYSDEIEEAIKDLKYCIDSFGYMQEVVKKVFEFARNYDESIELP